MKFTSEESSPSTCQFRLELFQGFQDSFSVIVHQQVVLAVKSPRDDANDLRGKRKSLRFVSNYTASSYKNRYRVLKDFRVIHPSNGATAKVGPWPPQCCIISGQLPVATVQKSNGRVDFLEQLVN
jgi:hypothetical protein